MNPRVKDVKPEDDYVISLTFDNGEARVFDMKPYLEKGFFKQLKEKGYFSSVRPFMGSIQWPNGQDLCPDVLFEESVAC